MTQDKASQPAVLVTGAARRVGAAISRRLARNGWKVLLHYHRSRTEAEDLAHEISELGGTCHLIEADLSNREELDGLIGRSKEIYGDLACLINNAAIFHYDDIATMTWDSLHQHLDTNLVAPALLCRDFARLTEPREDRCIINILDQKVSNLNPDFLSYTLSKVALSGLTTTLAMALAGRIRVCAIAPGLALVSGKQTQESFERAWRAPPLGRSTTPDEIATCAEFILTTPSMSGNSIFLDGGESLLGRQRDVAFDPGVSC